jgi:hypothetical protein
MFCPTFEHEGATGAATGCPVGFATVTGTGDVVIGTMGAGVGGGAVYPIIVDCPPGVTGIVEPCDTAS